MLSAAKQTKRSSALLLLSLFCLPGRFKDVQVMQILGNASVLEPTGIPVTGNLSIVIHLYTFKNIVGLRGLAKAMNGIDRNLAYPLQLNNG